MKQSDRQELQAFLNQHAMFRDGATLAPEAKLSKAKEQRWSNKGSRRNSRLTSTVGSKQTSPKTKSPQVRCSPSKQPSAEKQKQIGILDFNTKLKCELMKINRNSPRRKPFAASSVASSLAQSAVKPLETPPAKKKFQDWLDTSEQQSRDRFDAGLSP